jgi:hypothetical protein
MGHVEGAPLLKRIARGCGMVLFAALVLGGGGWWYYRANDGLHRRGSPFDRQSAKLYAALQTGETQSIDRILMEQPKLLHARYGSDGSVLHVAARYNHSDAIKLLTEWGADVADSSGRFGATPLHWAAWWGATDATAELLKRGAAVDAHAALGTPLRWAVRGAELRRNPKADYQALVKLLLDAGADVNGGDGRGWSVALEDADAGVAALLKSRGGRFMGPESESPDAPAPSKFARGPER